MQGSCTHRIRPGVFDGRGGGLPSIACGDERVENKRLGANFFSAPLAIALARLGRTEESRKYFLESLGDREILRQMASGYGITI